MAGQGGALVNITWLVAAAVAVHACMLPTTCALTMGHSMAPHPPLPGCNLAPHGRHARQSSRFASTNLRLHPSPPGTVGQSLDAQGYRLDLHALLGSPSPDSMLPISGALCCAVQAVHALLSFAAGMCTTRRQQSWRPYACGHAVMPSWRGPSWRGHAVMPEAPVRSYWNDRITAEQRMADLSPKVPYSCLLQSWHRQPPPAWAASTP